MTSKVKIKQGERYRGFTALSTYGWAPDGSCHQWRCVCECGKTKLIPENQLGKVDNCGNCVKNPRVPMVEFRGERILKSEAMKHAVVGRNLILERIKAGMSFEEAITTPKSSTKVRKKGKYSVFGEMLTMKEAVRRYGKVARQTVYLRMEGGMSIEDALTKDPEIGFQKGHTIRPSHPGRKPFKDEQVSGQVPANVRKQIVEASKGVKVEVLAELHGLDPQTVKYIIERELV